MAFKRPYLALLAVCVEISGIFFVEPEASDELRRLMILSGYGLALAFVWSNRRSRPILILGMGLLLNLAPMLANGGLMPVTPQKAAEAGLGEKIAGRAIGEAIPKTKDVLKEHGDTRLAPLTDVFVLPRSLHARGVASTGDVVIAFAVVLAFVSPAIAAVSRLRVRARPKRRAANGIAGPQTAKDGPLVIERARQSAR